MEHAARPPDAPPPARFGVAMLVALVAGAVALGAFAEIAEDVAGHDSQSTDLALMALLHGFSSPTLDLIARVLSALGSEVVVALTVVLVAVFAWQRRWSRALLLVATVAGAEALDSVLKSLFQRARPEPLGGWLGQAYSFPSGHATVAAAFYLFLTYLVWRRLGGVGRVAVVVAATLLVLLIGISRVYLEAHYPSDVLAGFATGFLWADYVLIGAHLVGRYRDRALTGDRPEGAVRGSRARA